MCLLFVHYLYLYLFRAHLSVHSCSVTSLMYTDGNKLVTLVFMVIVRFYALLQFSSCNANLMCTFPYILYRYVHACIDLLIFFVCLLCVYYVYICTNFYFFILFYLFFSRWNVCIVLWLDTSADEIVVTSTLLSQVLSFARL